MVIANGAKQSHNSLAFEKIAAARLSLWRHEGKLCKLFRSWRNICHSGVVWQARNGRPSYAPFVRKRCRINSITFNWRTHNREKVSRPRVNL